MHRVKKILYATDLRPEMRHACTHAFELAEQLDAQVCLIHVVDPSSLVATESIVGAEAEGEIVGDAVKQVRRRMEADGMPMQRIAGIEVVAGLTDDAILTEADRVGADMIVIGTSNRGVLSRMLSGSVAPGLLRKARIPVLIVPFVKGE